MVLHRLKFCVEQALLKDDLGQVPKFLKGQGTLVVFYEDLDCVDKSNEHIVKEVIVSVLVGLVVNKSTNLLFNQLSRLKQLVHNLFLFAELEIATQKLFKKIKVEPSVVELGAFANFV